MRDDMKKVLTERARVSRREDYRQHRNGLRREIGTDAETKRQRMRPYRDRKEFSDLVGPLRRYLEGQVGRPWNDVWSEISKQIDPSSTTGRHLRVHVWGFVEREVILIDGVPHRSRTSYLGRRYEIDGLYICPESGRLLRHTIRRRPRTKKPVDRIDHPDGTYLNRINGIWYRCRDERRETVRFGLHTVETRQYRTQLNRRELKRYHLRNDPAK